MSHPDFSIPQETADALAGQLTGGVPIPDVVRSNPDVAHALNAVLKSGGPADVSALLGQLGLESVDPGGRDRLASWIARLRGRRVTFAVLALLLFSLIPLGIAYLEGNLVNPALDADALHDIGHWNQFVIALPSAVMLMAMYFGQFPKTLIELVLSGVFPINQQQWNAFVRDARTIYRHWLLLILPYLIGIGMGLVGLNVYMLNVPNTWITVDLPSDMNWAGVVQLPLVVLLYYVIPAGGFRIIATYFVLRRFFRFPANIQPLHPDAAGGLSPLGRLSMRLNLGAFMFGLVAVNGARANVVTWGMPLLHPANIAIYSAYLIGASIIFFLPLFAAHNRMKEAKYQTLQIISDRFNQLNQSLIAELANAEGIDKSRIEELDSIQQLHAIASKMPVYPFNVQNISSFFGSVLTPILLIALEFAVSQLLG